MGKVNGHAGPFFNNLMVRELYAIVVGHSELFMFRQVLAFPLSGYGYPFGQRPIPPSIFMALALPLFRSV